MRKVRTHNTLERLNVDGRDILVFLMSLLLAFTIWLIHNLSLNYSETMSVPVVAECNIEGHADVSSNSSTIVARCRTSGFALLRNRQKGKRDATRIRFDAKDLHQVPGESETFTISSAELGNYVNEIYGDGVRLESFVSDNVQFRFPIENNKKVPVQASVVATFKSQYTSVGGLKLQPDSVTVYGEPFHLEMIDRVMTKTIEFTNLQVSAHGVVKLEEIPGVRISDEEVGYSLEVTRYVEISTEVVVALRNVPEGRKLSVYPSVAKVVYRCEFPLSVDPSETVRFYIDYEDFENSIGGKCVARSTELPDGVISYTIDPQVFGFIEEGKQ